jgi:hypothetical protein
MNCPETLRDLYGRMDVLVGETRARLQPGDVLIVLSDHGFKPFRRAVDVNAWLLAEGYLQVDEQGRPDWSRTRAIALGLAGLHVNLQGRQACGCVAPEQAEALKLELRERLLELVDPLDGTRPLLEVFDSRQCYQGPYCVDAPDLVLGWEVGYRIAKSAGGGKWATRFLPTTLPPGVGITACIPNGSPECFYAISLCARMPVCWTWPPPCWTFSECPGRLLWKVGRCASTSLPAGFAAAQLRRTAGTSNAGDRVGSGRLRSAGFAAPLGPGKIA